APSDEGPGSNGRERRASTGWSRAHAGRGTPARIDPTDHGPGRPPGDGHAHGAHGYHGPHRHTTDRAGPRATRPDRTGPARMRPAVRRPDPPWIGRGQP